MGQVALAFQAGVGLRQDDGDLERRRGRVREWSDGGGRVAMQTFGGRRWLMTAGGKFLLDDWMVLVKLGDLAEPLRQIHGRGWYLLIAESFRQERVPPTLEALVP
jgi:hypothetical protein